MQTHKSSKELTSKQQTSKHTKQANSQTNTSKRQESRHKQAHKATTNNKETTKQTQLSNSKQQPIEQSKESKKQTRKETSNSSREQASQQQASKQPLPQRPRTLCCPWVATYTASVKMIKRTYGDWYVPNPRALLSEFPSRTQCKRALVEEMFRWFSFLCQNASFGRMGCVLNNVFVRNSGVLVSFDE